MKQGVAEKWVKALRSGKYRQGRGRLQLGKEYCCLGVLCEVGYKNKIKVICNRDGSLRGADLNRQKPIKEWSGIKSDVGLLPSFMYYSKYLVSLAHINDTESRSFEEIADIIERHWNEL